MIRSVPPTRFARSGDARIAYQVTGDGPVDLVVVGGPSSHLDLQWDEPQTVRWIERLSSFSRLVRFDRRGTGLSDPVEGALTLEQQVDDLRAILAAERIERVALVGAVEAGLCAMFAASHPAAVTSLVLANVAPAGSSVLSPNGAERFLDLIENHWGEGAFLDIYAPGRRDDRRFVEWWTRYERSCVSAAMARRILELNLQTDLRGVLPTIRVPTLVLHCEGNLLFPPEVGRELAALIPGARFRAFPGTDVYAWPDADGPAMDELEEFLTGRRGAREPDRVLSTVLFTDIVGSTQRASELGDQRWRDLLDRHNRLVREELARWQGIEVKTVGDGFLATFDGPARAVRCATAVVQGMGELGLEVRAGLHTGECERMDGDLGGIAVHIGARIAAMAGGGEVLVSSTVRELVVGSGLRFADRGVHELRGVPGEWRVYAVDP